MATVGSRKELKSLPTAMLTYIDITFIQDLQNTIRNMEYGGLLSAKLLDQWRERYRWGHGTAYKQADERNGYNDNHGKFLVETAPKKLSVREQQKMDEINALTENEREAYFENMGHYPDETTTDHTDDTLTPSDKNKIQRVHTNINLINTHISDFLGMKITTKSNLGTMIRLIDQIFELVERTTKDMEKTIIAAGYAPGQFGAEIWKDADEVMFGSWSREGGAGFLFKELKKRKFEGVTRTMTHGMTVKLLTESICNSLMGELGY
jgi:hypothetical protein